MSLIQLLKFKTWETRLFKMPRLEMPRFQTRHWVTVAFWAQSNSFSIFVTHIQYRVNKNLVQFQKINLSLNGHCPEATVTLVPVWKRGVSKRGILKSLVSHFLNFKSWIKLIYDTIDVCNFVINEFNPTFEVQESENVVLQNTSF